MLGGKREFLVDGTHVVATYLLVLFVLSGRLIISGLPIRIAPAVVVAAMIGVCWLCAQMTNSLNVGKGPSVVRRAVVLLFCTTLMSYAVATRRYLPAEFVSLADSGMIRIAAVVGVSLFLADCVNGLHRSTE